MNELPGDGSSSLLLSYADLANILDSLPLLLRESRRQRGLNLRDAATQVGVGHTTLARIERGEDAVLSTVIAVMRWMDLRSSAAGGER